MFLSLQKRFFLWYVIIVILVITVICIVIYTRCKVKQFEDILSEANVIREKNI